VQGTLPVINAEAVDLAIRAGIALNAHIARRSQFDRKQYFYADLPKGYQISQYDVPVCSSGHLEVDTPEGPKRCVRGGCARRWCCWPGRADASGLAFSLPRFTQHTLPPRVSPACQVWHHARAPGGGRGQERARRRRQPQRQLTHARGLQQGW
jgi:hypothetical protein